MKKEKTHLTWRNWVEVLGIMLLLAFTFIGMINVAKELFVVDTIGDGLLVIGVALLFNVLLKIVPFRKVE